MLQIITLTNTLEDNYNFKNYSYNPENPRKTKEWCSVRVMICRGHKSLVRVEKNGRIGYFQAGRHISEWRVKYLAHQGNYTRWEAK